MNEACAYSQSTEIAKNQTRRHLQSVSSLFSVNQQFSTGATKSGSSSSNYELQYLDRQNLNCNGYGMNSFAMVNEYSQPSDDFWNNRNYIYFNIQCVSPGFPSTSTYSISNVQPVQGGTIPVQNIIFFQYLNVDNGNVLDCSSVGGAVTQFHFVNQNNNANAGFQYTCGVFGQFQLSSCRTTSSQYAQSVGSSSYSSGGNLNYLDRNPVSCNSNEAIQSLQFDTMNNNVYNQNYQHDGCTWEHICPDHQIFQYIDPIYYANNFVTYHFASPGRDLGL